MAKKREINALLPYFGGNRTLAHAVGEELAGAAWVAVPFAGGMPELQFIDAPAVVVSDIHRDVINLAKVAADEWTGPILYRRLKRLAYHPDILAESQAYCRAAQYTPPSVNAAFHYFVAAWMGRSAQTGTDREFGGKLPVRYTSSGGDSVTRFRSAVRGLLQFRRIAARCNFLIADAFDILANVVDDPRHMIYCDPPFPGAGEAYRHKFTADDQRRLAAAVGRFERARVVMRFYDDPLIRELYPLPRWHWSHAIAKTQGNTERGDLLIINGPPRKASQ